MNPEAVIWDNYLDWARHMRDPTPAPGEYFEPVFIQAHNRVALIVLRFMIAWRWIAIDRTEFRRLRRAIHAANPELQFMIYRPEALTPAAHDQYSHIYDVLDVGVPVRMN